MKYYLTTPIYYVNDSPHIGHAYTTVAADVLARFERLNGKQVFFLTGTDEHGAKIAQAAAKAGISPKELCDRNAAAFKQAWQNLGITNDRFIRTTDPDHEQAVQALMAKLHADGHIYKGKYEGLYCVACEKFLSPEDLDENQCCPDHKQKPVAQSEENYYFRLSAFRDRLLAILSDDHHPDHIGVFPIERRNEIIGKLKVGLEDISISRAALSWGIPLPFDPQQTVYVWVDALINYISAIGYNRDRAQFETYWPADVHLMAKDILWFHSVIWPSLLMAAGLPLPRRVTAHGFFTIGGQKMSKTLGNVIRPDELIARFGVDASRYLLLALIPFGVDGDISWQSLGERYNTDLANNFGNLVSRTVTMVDKYFAGAVPPPPAAPVLGPRVAETLAPVAAHLERIEFHRAIEHIQKAVDAANRHIEESAPWKMAKEQNPALGGVLHELLAAIGLVTLHLIPFMPDVSRKVWEQIGQTGSVEDAGRRYFTGTPAPADLPRPGARVAKTGILFPRITA
jgi:methionyl-tRNA synthetase